MNCSPKKKNAMNLVAGVVIKGFALVIGLSVIIIPCYHGLQLYICVGSVAYWLMIKVASLCCWMIVRVDRLLFSGVDILHFENFTIPIESFICCFAQELCYE